MLPCLSLGTSFKLRTKKEIKQTLPSRNSQLDAGTDTYHRSCRDPEQASEPALGARESFTEEEFSGDLFGIG